MSRLTTLKPVDYLMIGHITSDLQQDGSSKLGGTVSFSGLTAQRLGHEVGVVTSHADDLQFPSLSGLNLINVPSGKTTTFRNISTQEGRVQYCYERANSLSIEDVPEQWRNSAIVHIGPVANEIEPNLFHAFPQSLLCLTPQGCLRKIDENGLVSFQDWSEKADFLPKADAVVLSLEDLQKDEDLVAEFANLCKLLVITENFNGARVYWKQEVRHFPAPSRNLIEDTGAGDIFAASFFHRLKVTDDPWKAARFAVELSANSVTRYYLDSIPTGDEIEHARMQNK